MGWVVDEGWIVSGFLVCPEGLLVAEVGETVVGGAGVQPAPRFCIVRALSG